MHEDRSHPLLAQLPLTVSPFISLPTATTLPYTYKTLPSTLPQSSTGSSASNGERAKYVVSSAGHSAHPDDIVKSCKALGAYLKKNQDDADAELKAWEDTIAARELAEKRRVAPGWLDSDARILQPERRTSDKGKTVATGLNNSLDTSSAEVSNQTAEGQVHFGGDGEALDRAFGPKQRPGTNNALRHARALSNSGPQELTKSSRNKPENNDGFCMMLSPPRMVHIIRRPLRTVGISCRTSYSSPLTRFHASYWSNGGECLNLTCQCLSNAGARRFVTTSPALIHDEFATARKPTNDRSPLRNALLDLQKHSSSFINVSRLQLALRGLEQTTGKETIRVAVLSLSGQRQACRSIRELVRVLLADPLKNEEEWEKLLVSEENTRRPLLLRVGGEPDDDASSSGLGNKLVYELNVTSPQLSGCRLEILIQESEIAPGVGLQADAASQVLTPKIEIPTSRTGRYTPVITPVHKALVVGSGISGISTLNNISSEVDSQAVLLAADIPNYRSDDTQTSLNVVNIDLASAALHSFRQSLDNAISYEHQWFESGLPDILSWLKNGSVDEPSSELMKSPLKRLIQSLLQDARAKLRTEESQKFTKLLASKLSSADQTALRVDLRNWAETAHIELRDQLDIAFTGARWRKLGWWKLFWRVDDVSMITSDILNQRFLPEAEKSLIYLSGQISQATPGKMPPRPAGAFQRHENSTEMPVSTSFGSIPGPLYMDDIAAPLGDEILTGLKNRPWPLDIPLARIYLLSEPNPALQSLAQRLVMQTISTSGLSSIFAGLLYLSNSITSIYEIGAVAALGIVWSFSRQQRKWETARLFWEGEVREEGRKSIRATEAMVTEMLSEKGIEVIEGHEEVTQARLLIENAQEALDNTERTLKGSST